MSPAGISRSMQTTTIDRRVGSASNPKVSASWAVWSGCNPAFCIDEQLNDCSIVVNPPWVIFRRPRCDPGTSGLIRNQPSRRASRSAPSRRRSGDRRDVSRAPRSAARRSRRRSSGPRGPRPGCLGRGRGPAGSARCPRPPAGGRRLPAAARRCRPGRAAPPGSPDGGAPGPRRPGSRTMRARLRSASGQVLASRSQVILPQSKDSSRGLGWLLVNDWFILLGLA